MGWMFLRSEHYNGEFSAVTMKKKNIVWTKFHVLDL